jgi:Icc-related predicted phosphoesterase
MSILFAGDTHGNNRHIAYLFETAKREGCDTIFQVGDFGYWPHDDRGLLFLCNVDAHIQDTGIQFYWIDGNHDNHDAIAAMPVSDDGLRYLTMDGGLVHVPRGASLYIDNLLIMGYGGAFSIDRKYRTLGESYWEGETIDWHDCLLAGHRMRQQKPDVLVTHDAPAGFPLGNVYKGEFRETTASRSALRTLMLTVEPRRVICGHWHERKTAQVDGYRIDVLDCDQAKDRRDSWVVVDGSNDRCNTYSFEEEVPYGEEVQEPGVGRWDGASEEKDRVAVG